MSLPSFNTNIQELSLMQSKWADLIDPVINLPTNKGIILKDISLVSGRNSVDHRLSRKLQGWYLIRKRSNAAVWDDQDNNKIPSLTLILMSDSAVNVDIFVF